MKSLTPRMLFVSGDYDFCDGLAEVLRDQGLSVDCIYDTQSAAEALQVTAYDLVILDHWPPFLNAIPLLRRLKQEFERPTVVTLFGPSIDAAARIELRENSDVALKKTGDGDDVLCLARKLASRSFAAA